MWGLVDDQCQKFGIFDGRLLIRHILPLHILNF